MATKTPDVVKFCAGLTTKQLYLLIQRWNSEPAKDELARRKEKHL